MRWEIDSALWSRSQSESNQPALLPTCGVRIFIICCLTHSPLSDKRQELDRGHLSASSGNLSGQVVGRAADWPASTQHLLRLMRDVRGNSWSETRTRNSWSRLDAGYGAPLRQVAPVTRPPARSLYGRPEPFECRITLPRRKFESSFRFRPIVSAMDARFFVKKCVKRRDGIFLTNLHSSSSIVVNLCCDTTLLERDQSGPSCHYFLAGLLIDEKIREQSYIWFFVENRQNFEIPYIVLRVLYFF